MIYQLVVTAPIHVLRDVDAFSCVFGVSLTDGKLRNSCRHHCVKGSQDFPYIFFSHTKTIYWRMRAMKNSERIGERQCFVLKRSENSSFFLRKNLVLELPIFQHSKKVS